MHRLCSIYTSASHNGVIALHHISTEDLFLQDGIMLVYTYLAVIPNSEFILSTTALDEVTYAP